MEGIGGSQHKPAALFTANTLQHPTLFLSVTRVKLGDRRCFLSCNSTYLPTSSAHKHRSRQAHTHKARKDESRSNTYSRPSNSMGHTAQTAFAKTKQIHH